MCGFALWRMNEFCGDNYQRFGTFTVTVEDAKEYLYSFSTHRRVYKFEDIKVNLYI